MVLRRFLVLGVAGVVALGAAGCGGDDDSTDSSDASVATDSTTATTLTEEEFTTQANAICVAGNKEIDAADPFSGGQPTEDELNSYVTDTLVPNIQGQIDAISALGAPESEADDVTQFLDDAQTALDGIEADPSSISETTFSDVNDQAVALGLDDCAS